MERALITGGAGFIGSNIAELLVEEGYEVVVLDSLYLGSEDNLSEIRGDIEFVQGSVTDIEAAKDAIKGCDVVFHQAARSSAPMHKEDPAEGAKINVEGFVNVVEAAREEEVEKVVYASTSSMYGSVKPPHKEYMGEYPTNLYTASKMSRELYAKVYSQQTDINFTGLRYFSVYGPHEKAKDKYANVLTQFMWKMLDGERPVIWGDGTQTRDFTYVKDIARANLLAAEKRNEKVDGEYFNIGTGRDVSFNALVENLNETLGTDIEPEYIEHPRDNPVMATKADYSRAKEKLGYEPQYSFEEGLKRTADYYQENR